MRTLFVTTVVSAALLFGAGVASAEPVVSAADSSVAAVSSSTNSMSHACQQQLEPGTPEFKSAQVARQYVEETPGFVHTGNDVFEKTFDDGSVATWDSRNCIFHADNPIGGTSFVFRIPGSKTDWTSSKVLYCAGRPADPPTNVVDPQPALRIICDNGTIALAPGM